MNKLQAFILAYLEEKKLSRRELAEKMVVQHRTLNYYLNTGNSPTLYFLTRLSNATGYDLLTLVAQAEPDYVDEARADIMLIAQRIHKLPEPQRGVILQLISSALKGDEDSGNEGKVGKWNKGKGSKKR